MSDPILKPIPGFKEYCAGSDGHIYRMSRGRTCVIGIKYPRRLSPRIGSGGYSSVAVVDDDWKCRGPFLLDESTWLPVCRPHHDEIGRRPKWALERGYNLSRLAKSSSTTNTSHTDK